MKVSVTVRKATKKHQMNLMEKEGVVAVMAGKEYVGGKQTGRDAVVVLVQKKLPLAQVADVDLVPGELDVDADVVPTDVIEVGEIFAQEVSHKSKFRPVVPGTSIAHYSVTAGTVGVIVEKNGEAFILSNNHVLANSNDALIGDQVWQPGKADGGKAADVVARLSHFIPISFTNSNKVDCALAQFVDVANVPPPPAPKPPVEIPDFFDDTDRPLPPIPPPPPPAAPPKKKMNFIEKILYAVKKILYKLVGKDIKKETVQVVQMQSLVEFSNIPHNMPIAITKQLSTVEVGDKVQKSGRTTGYTTGEVIGLDASVSVNYGGTKGNAKFVDQIICTAMSAGGDSGSAVYDMNGNMIGLLFAGSTTVTILNRAEEVFNALDIDRIV